MSQKAFMIEQTYQSSASRIWKAISDKEEMKLWYFDLKEFRPEVGFEFQFWGGPSADRQYHHLCKITEAIQDKKLAYTWKYEGYEGETLVTFELFNEDQKTRLKMTHQGLETFPASNPDFSKENFAEGWTSIIGTSLKEHLSKTIQK